MMSKEVKYYYDPETGDYSDVIEPEENKSNVRNKYQVMINGDPMELTEKEYESYMEKKLKNAFYEAVKPMSYAEEQLRHAEEKDRTFEPYYRGREYFLDEAKTIVCNDREGQYGKPEDSFRLIAELWTAYLFNDNVGSLSATDVAIMMALLKIARISSGKFKEDSWIDAIGYLACGAELDCAKRGDK